MSTPSLKRCAGLSALLAATAAIALPAAAGATTTVVASKIDNPRGIALGADGTLYVASSGAAGPRCFGKGEEQTCFGRTGSVLAIKDGKKTTLSKGFVSVGAPDGSFSTGPTAVSVAPDGTVMMTVTSATEQEIAPFPAWAKRQAGGLFAITPASRAKVASISAYEYAHNTDRVKGDRNSNPYGVLALADQTLVADAGANAILSVRGGTVAPFAVIPPNGKQQPVPTSIALGPDGNVYVGELALAAGPGKARIWRIPAAGGTPEQVATGFTAISGLAFGPDGTMYVSQLSSDLEKFKPGSVVAVAPDGTRTTISDKNMMFPAGVAVDATGVYVATNSVAPATTPKKSPFGGAGGQIVKITP